MTRAPTPLVSVLRGLIAKAVEQPTMFGPANPELTPTKKVVRRKGGGTHVQTFYTRKDERPKPTQGAMFDTPEPAAAPAPAPAPAERPSVLDALRAPERKPRAAKKPAPTGGMFDQPPTEAPAPAAPKAPAAAKPTSTPPAAAGPVPPDLAAYFDRLKVPARRQYAQAVWAEMRGGPPADSVIELTDSTAGTGAEMMARIRMKVERYAGTPKPAPAAEPATDKDHYQADAAPEPAKPGTIPPPAEQDDTAGRVAVRVLQAIGEAGGVDLLADLGAATDYHLRIEPPVKGMQPLVIEKHGRDIMLTHYRDQGGDRILDSEVIFRVDDLGQVRLHQTAVEDPWRGGENRGFDRAFARMLLHHLETDGYTTTGREHWRGKNAPKRDEPDPASAGAFDDPTLVDDDKPSAPSAGLVDAMNGDAEAAAKVHAAITSLGRPDWQSDFMRSREVMNAIAGALGARRLTPGDRLSRAYLYARGAPEYGAPNGDPGIEVTQHVRTDSLHEGMTRTIDGLTYILRRSNDGAGPLRWFAAEDALDASDDAPQKEPERPSAPERDADAIRADLERVKNDLQRRQVESVRAGGTGNEAPALSQRLEALRSELAAATAAPAPPKPKPDEPPLGASYAPDSLRAYEHQGGRLRGRVNPSTQYVYASTLRPLSVGWAVKLRPLLHSRAAEIVDSPMPPKRDERAHSYVFSDAPLDPDITRAYQLTLVHEPPAAAGPKPAPTTALDFRAHVIDTLAADERNIAFVRQNYGTGSQSLLQDILRKKAIEIASAALVTDRGNRDNVQAFKEFTEYGGLKHAVDAFMKQHAASRSEPEPAEPAPAAPRAKRTRSFGFDAVPRATRQSMKNARLAANQKAIDIAKALDAEARDATDEEREALAAYTGDGGLTGDLNAHYTPTALASAMWDALKAAGFEGGRVLEPSMGAGVFLHTAPDGATMTGVEYSSTTGSIAKHLHEPAGHTVHGGMPFEQYNLTSTDEPFDAIIANPPYGLRGATIALDKPEFATAEEYFIDATLDRLKDGGVAAYLINDGPFTRGGSHDFRVRLLARADVLALKQLPTSTFGDSNSGVPPVVLVLRKRPHEDGLALARLADRHGTDVLTAAGVTHEGILTGRHLTRDSGHILGDWDGEARTYSGYKDIKGDLTPERLAALASGMSAPRDINEDAVRNLVGEDELASARAYAAGRGSGRLPDGTISEDGRYILKVGESGERRWHRIEQEQPTVAASLDVSRGLKEFVHVRNNALDRGEAEQHRVRALDAVQAYLREHGNPHEDPHVKALARQRHELAHLLALVNPDGTIKAALTTPLTTEAGAETLDTRDPEHIAQHLYRSGRLTPRNLLVWAQANEATGIGTVDAAREFLEQHYALEPNGRWTPAHEFYVGRVLDKADLMDATAANATDGADARTYRRQAKRLRDLVPTASADTFRVTARDHFVPPHVIAAYLNDRYADGDEAFEVRRENGVVYATQLSRYADRDFEDFQKYLNYSLTPEAVRGQESMSREEVKAERQASQARALDQQKQYDEAFAAWLLSSPYRDEVEREYTRRVLGYIPPTLDGTALPLAEWTGPTLHEYQNQAVRHALAAGNSIMALDVGLGKTHAGAALAGMLLQDGRAKKPMVVVPKSLLANWRRHLPNDLKGRKVLVVGETEQEDGTFREDDGVRVAQKLIDAATGDYDAVLITRDWYGRIPIRAENFQRLVDEDLEAKRQSQLANEQGAFKGQGRRGRKKTERDELKEETKHQQKAANKQFLATLAGLHFEDLGIDALIVDEAQAYKNLHGAPRVVGASPKFMGGGAESKRAQDFLHKSILTRERTGGSNVFFLTATPTKNSPLELFNMLKHLDHQALVKIGIPYTDAFVDRYCDIRPGLVMGMTGQDLEPRPLVAGFRHLRELRGIMEQYIFRRTGADADIVRQMGGLPERRDVKHDIEMDDDVRAEYRRLAAEAKAAAGRKDVSGSEHAFSFMSRMQKLTMDPALHDATFMGRPNPRFRQAASITRSAIDEGGKVVMFMDIGKQPGDDTIDGGDALDGMGADALAALMEEYQIDAGTKPAAAKKLLRERMDAAAGNAYDRLVQNLVESGIPREQIAVVTADTAKTSSSREAIKQAYNRGDIKVIIGSTGVIGEGFSLQRGTTDMIHLDTPWDPGTYQQRLGRTVRQGNKQPFVRNHVLVARGSMDALRLTTLQGKKGWTEQLWDSDADEVENPEAAVNAIQQYAASLADDPAAAEAAIREHTEKQNAMAADARVTLAKRAVERHALAVTSVLERRARLNALKEDIKSLEDRDARGYLGGPDKERLERMRKRVPTLEAATQRGIEEARTNALRFKDDPDLPADLREVIASGKPFLMDKQQRPIAEGSIINFGTRIMRVDSLDVSRRELKLKPVGLTDDHRHSTPHAMKLDDVTATHEIALTRTPELTRQLIKVEVRAPTDLRGLDPRITRENADAIQEALRERKPNRAWLINERTGAVHLAEHSRGVEPGRNERFLVNTPEDFAAFTRVHATPEALRASEDRDGAWASPFSEEWTPDGRRFVTPTERAAKAARASLADALTRTLARLGISMEA